SRRRPQTGAPPGATAPTPPTAAFMQPGGPHASIDPSGRSGEIRDRLARLPRLGQTNDTAATIRCKVCGNAAAFFDVVDFNKCAAFYPFGPSGVVVSYYRCDDCGFLFTPVCDEWSHDDFTRLIYNDDYILLDPEYLSDRPLRMADL